MAELFDRFINALDPNGEEAQTAEHQFNQKAEALHSTHAPEIEFRTFRYELFRECREIPGKKLIRHILGRPRGQTQAPINVRGPDAKFLLTNSGAK